MTAYEMRGGVLAPMKGSGSAPVDPGPVWKPGRPTVIHPMGDSMTRGQGAESQGGYRGPLWGLLRGAGKSISTTGARNDTPGPHRWSGEGGWRIQELASPGVRNTTGFSAIDWVRTYPADIVLLHIGTNNTGSPQIPNPVLAERLVELLEGMYAYAPTTHFFIASPLVQSNPKWDGSMHYSNEVDKAVQPLISSGRPYHLVRGMDKIVGAANYNDPIHLNPAGYTLMAQTWADALLAEQ